MEMEQRYNTIRNPQTETVKTLQDTGRWRRWQGKKKNQKNNGEEENKTNQNIKLGTWNLERVYEKGTIKTLSKEAKKYNTDIFAVQETHLKGSNIIEVGDFKYTWKIHHNIRAILQNTAEI